MRYIFGPVISRRLGRSLGIDLIPHKTCSLDCVYCECGDTTELTVERREWVPTHEVVAELRTVLSAGPELDAVTFAGSGEPTLHSGIGDIIRFLKTGFPAYQVVVLTNATLLWRQDVRLDILEADTVIPSLDAVGREAFNTILRPAPDVTPQQIVDGLVAFRGDYKGRLVLEVFIVPGVNDTESELTLIREAALRIAPDLLQLNHLDRPGILPWVSDVPADELQRIAEFFHPLPSVIVGARGSRHGHVDDEHIIRYLRRGPATAAEISRALGLGRSETGKMLAKLARDRRIVVEMGIEDMVYGLNPSGEGDQ